MKVVRSKHLTLTLERGTGSWSFTVPTGLVQTIRPKERLRIVVRQLVFRNDFLTIKPGQWISIDNMPAPIRPGSPNALQLCAELSSKADFFSFSFDSYDGRIGVVNTGSVTHSLKPGTLAAVLGMDEGVDLEPGESYVFPRGVDLAPPEFLNLRMTGLSSSSLEIKASGFRSSDLLCAIGNDAPPYATSIFRDSMSEYGHILSADSLNTISFRLVNEADEEQISNSPMLMLLACETVIDEESNILEVLQRTYDIQALQVLRPIR